MAVELTSILNLDKINVSGMSTPKPETLAYYEAYYLAEGQFANAITVDEHWNIRSGYVTYLLARKYGVRPPIFEVRASRSLIKVVRGRNVRYMAWEWKVVNTRLISRICTLKEPVVPGDILRVEAQNGEIYMQVESVEHVDGTVGCAGMRKTLKRVRKSKRIMESGL